MTPHSEWLVVGHQLSVIGCQSSVVSHRLSVIGLTNVSDNSNALKKYQLKICLRRSNIIQKLNMSLNMFEKLQPLLNCNNIFWKSWWEGRSVAVTCTAALNLSPNCSLSEANLSVEFDH